jgi:hypothetical protein
LLNICLLDVFGGKIREFSAKDKKYCFEIVAKGKKGLKKYSFAVDAQGDRKLWVDQLTKVSKIKQGSATEEGGPAGPGNLNPIHDGDENEPDQERNMPFLRMSSNKIKPDGKEGYLMKKSPSVFKGWQKRYFVIHDPGEMDYYETVRLLLHSWLVLMGRLWCDINRVLLRMTNRSPIHKCVLQ